MNLSRICRVRDGRTFRAVAYDLSEIIRRFLKKSFAPRERLRKLAGKKVLTHNESSATIIKFLRGQEAFIVSRLGTTEMRTLSKPIRSSKLSQVASALATLSGVYPAEPETVKRFGDLYSSWIAEVDVLGVRDETSEQVFWKNERSAIKRFFRGSNLISIEDLLPLEHDFPWTLQLGGKKVLVVHPFEVSIRKQAPFVENLYSKPFIPQMEIDVLRPPQLLADSSERENYQDWFEAFESISHLLRQKIDSFRPDVSLIGAGAFGLGLAVVSKKAGVPAIHIGGALQLFFGIRGKRWIEDQRLQHFTLGENWIDSDGSEMPQGFGKVEGGCYW